VTLDVVSEIVIARERELVARYAADPDNAPSWYPNIESVEWLTSRPVAVGSRVAFVAHFLGRRMAYTYEVVEYVPGERLVMRTTEGRPAMETTYTWRDLGDSATRMTLRNRGKPPRLLRPLVQRAVRRANAKDLERLRTIFERQLPGIVRAGIP
jgi:uncharacterized protein YndB with AHSA1/START domain